MPIIGMKTRSQGPANELKKFPINAPSIYPTDRVHLLAIVGPNAPAIRNCATIKEIGEKATTIAMYKAAYVMVKAKFLMFILKCVFYFPAPGFYMAERVGDTTHPNFDICEINAFAIFHGFWAIHNSSNIPTCKFPCGNLGFLEL